MINRKLNLVQATNHRVGSYMYTSIFKVSLGYFKQNQWILSFHDLWPSLLQYAFSYIMI